MMRIERMENERFGMETAKVWKELRVLSALVTLALMLFVWPVHPFREVASVRSGDENHVITAPLQIGESITQYFQAPENNIIQLEFVLTSEEDSPRQGEILFEFIDESGEALYQQTYEYGEIPDYGYDGPVLNLRLKKGKTYAYRLTNLSIRENMPCGVFTTDQRMRCLKKGSLELPGQTLEGELLTRLNTNSPLTAENTLAIWGCIAMVGFSVYELLRRLSKRDLAKI